MSNGALSPGESNRPEKPLLEYLILAEIVRTTRIHDEVSRPRQPSDELHQPPHRLAQHRPPGRVRPMDRIDRLCEIDTDSSNLFLSVIFSLSFELN